ncbi:MAG: DNA/RNA nuclease SfsA [Gammaproteobacteria bacterium]|nr:DNA/RNA nuclease SfsA [Gammaproteobacteria bacterium]
MKFNPKLKEGILLRRYKRFFADVLTENETLTMHCANTGAMHGCADPGSKAWYSTSTNPKRKLPHSLEFVETKQGFRVCVNTARANQLVQEALLSNEIPELAKQSVWSREVPIPGERGRFDFGSENVVMEVKMVSWLRRGMGVFPDAESIRATRHLNALKNCAKNGIRAILFFCVPHSGVDQITIAEDIDPSYGRAVREAVADRVEILAYRWSVSPTALALDKQIPFHVPV